MADSTQSTNHFEDFWKNSGPKQDCLVKICAFLEVPDLIKLCALFGQDLFAEDNESFTEFLVDRVMIHKKLFDFTQIQSQQRAWSVNKVFDTFGKSMRKLKVSLLLLPSTQRNA